MEELQRLHNKKKQIRSEQHRHKYISVGFYRQLNQPDEIYSEDKIKWINPMIKD